MDLLALILAIVAALVFLDGCRTAPFIRRSVHIALGLAILTVALVFQFTTITDHLVNW